jgi:uncharacterized protein YjiS (DUF1127 family)
MPTSRAARRPMMEPPRRPGRSRLVAMNVAANRVTAVAIKVRGGTLWKHGTGRVSLTNTAWEISMPFSKPLPCVPSSSRGPAPRPTDRYIALAPTRRSGDEAQETLLPFPRQASPQRRIWVAASRFIAEGAARSAHAMHALPNLPIVIVSWLVAEFFAGCAAYAQALYPIFPLEDDAADPCGRVAPAAAGQGNAPRSRPVLSLVPMMASSETDGAVPVRARNQPSPHSSSRVGCMSQAEPMRAGHAGWCASVNAVAMTLLSKLRLGREQRRTADALRLLDDRTLRDIGICRGDIESAKRESRRE